MIRVSQYRITLTRGAAPAAPPPRGRTRATALRAIAVTAGALTITGLTAQASATPNPNGGATVNATVNTSFPIKSVTVTLPASTTVLTYGGCSGGSSTSTAVGFPNGICKTATYTVANSGNTSEEIDITGSVASPSDASANVWQPCIISGQNGTGAPACSGASGAAGVDQYNETATAQPSQSPPPPTILTTAAACDEAFNACGALVSSGASAVENLQMEAPSSSTDKSPSFSMTVVYTAV